MRNSGPQPDPVRPRGASPHVGGEVLRVLWAWVRGQLIVSSILTCVYAVGFALLRVPWWFLFAPFCGLSNLVPMFGTPIAMAVTLFVTWLAGADFTRVLMVAGVFLVAMTLEGYFLTPRILGRRLNLPPLLVFFGVLAGGMLFGFFGLLLAVPVMAVAAVLWRYYRKPSAPAP